MMREEVAETLQHFLRDTEVLEWLEYLAASDEDERVRRQAEDSLTEYYGPPQKGALRKARLTRTRVGFGRSFGPRGRAVVQ